MLELHFLPRNKVPTRLIAFSSVIFVTVAETFLGCWGVPCLVERAFLLDTAIANCFPIAEAATLRAVT